MIRNSVTVLRLFLTGTVIYLSICSAMAHAFCFDDAARANNISAHLLESIARVESGLNSKAVHTNVNGTTDLGLMQINSAWIDTLQLNREHLLSDPCYNVKTGAGILRQCIDRHGYTWEAVGCYNAKSKDKRVGYSWKVYRELKKEKGRAVAKKKEATPEEARGQSLYFKVRERERTIISEEP